MQRINEEYQLDRVELLFLSFYLVIMTVELSVEYYSGMGIGWALMLFRGLSILTPLFAIELMLKHPMQSNTYRSTVCIYFLFLLAWSLIAYILQQNANVSLFSATIYFAIPLGVSLGVVNAEAFKKSFCIICLIGIACFFFVWFMYDIDISKALRRYYTWSNIFFWAGVFWAIIPVILYCVIFNCSKIYKTVAITYWMCGVVFNLIFLKRFIIVDSILILIMICVFLLCEGKINIRSFLYALLLVGIAVLVVHFASDSAIGSLWKGVIGRFDDTTMTEFDRFEEARIYFSNTKPIYVILGRGLWGAHSSFGVLNEALHVGWCNWIHKGGIVLFLFAFIPSIKAFILLPKMKELDSKTKWAVCMACIYAGRLFYSNMHAHYPEMVMVFFSYAVIMNYKLPTGYSRKSRYLK